MRYHKRSFARSVGFALRGIYDAVKYEYHMRVHVSIAGAAVLAGIFLEIEHAEWMYMSITITLVLFAELMNTAIESYVDLATEEIEEEARIAKDVAAGAVLVTSLHALIAGLIIFSPYLLELL
ncbi:MAG TPA: diacylglycerol kinase family protein [Sediminispirochaeta sp.]|nr:diacylglycerol kinase family protein [Sediminispirochaeta sp.]